MPENTYTVKTLSGATYQVTINDSEDVFTLLEAIAKKVGIPLRQLEVVPKDTGHSLSQYKNHTIRNEEYLRGNKVLFARARARGPQNYTMVGRTPNTTSIVDLNERRYHTRILGEKLNAIRRRHEREGLTSVAERYALPENVERNIARGFLGHSKGGKTRKSKKSRRQTRRRR